MRLRYPASLFGKCLHLSSIGLALLQVSCQTTVAPHEGTPTEASVEANLIIGTQAIGGPYQFTDQPYLIEVARELEAMGSNIIKFATSPKYDKRIYKLETVPGIDSLTDLFQKHPVYQEILSMGFRDYFFWASPFSSVKWKDGLSQREAEDLYRETRDLADYLLTEYSGTGKIFHMGHWEGDWLLLPGFQRELDPDPIVIKGFTQYLQVRQKAINDARTMTPHSDVTIYHYTEVNLVMKGLDGSRPTLTNTVLPQVDIDYVSYSSYDSIQEEDMAVQVKKALDHIESMMIPRPEWEGKRVYVGEFAIRASLVDFDPDEHDRRNREVIKVLLEWGCPYILYWQMYCNEPNTDFPQGYNGFWLIDPQEKRYPLYYTLKEYWQAAATYSNEIKQNTGIAPTIFEMRQFALNYFKS